MKLGEVCLLTENVRRLADFYKKLLQVENGSEDGIPRARHRSGARLSSSAYSNGSFKKESLRGLFFLF